MIRELVMSLFYNYKVKEVYGIQFGYKGFYNHEWIQLFPETVKTIHKLGGTMLGSSRGGFQKDKIVNLLKQKGINHVKYLLLLLMMFDGGLRDRRRRNP